MGDQRTLHHIVCLIMLIITVIIIIMTVPLVSCLADWVTRQEELLRESVRCVSVSDFDIERFLLKIIKLAFNMKPLKEIKHTHGPGV